MISKTFSITCVACMIYLLALLRARRHVIAGNLLDDLACLKVRWCYWAQARFSLQQDFSKCAPWTSISITLQLVRNANYWALSQTYWVENLGGRPNNLCFYKSSSVILTQTKTEKGQFEESLVNLTINVRTLASILSSLKI